MSEQPRVGDPRAPKEIDRADVLGELEYRFPASAANNALAWVLDELAELDILRFRESADDPSKDPVGTLRREDVDGEPPHLNLWQRLANPMRWMCTHSTTTGMVGEVLQSDQVAGFEVIGSVPGTPAAEAQAEAELDKPLLEWEMELLELGHSPKPGPRRPRRSSPHGWEPRVFHSDGPEPPADVEVLEYLEYEPALHIYQYVCRPPAHPRRWEWRRDPDEAATAGQLFLWPPSSPGRYREVRS